MDASKKRHQDSQVPHSTAESRVYVFYTSLSCFFYVICFPELFSSLIDLRKNFLDVFMPVSTFFVFLFLYLISEKII